MKGYGLNTEIIQKSILVTYATILIMLSYQDGISKLENMESINHEGSILGNSQQETLNILIYSDIFHYPLTKNEIYERGKITFNELESALSSLVLGEKIYHFGEFYSLKKGKDIINSRIARNSLAKVYFQKARIMTRIIACFPYVRAIFLSGSISKNCMDKNSDIDYFIITESNRLWIVRLFCFIFRRIFLFNNAKLFCTNFLIDLENLQIQDHSIYTAIEIKTLTPMYGHKYYEKLLKANDWTNVYLPKYPAHENIDAIKSQLYIQKLFEVIFNNKFGDWLDTWFMKKTIVRRSKIVIPKFMHNSIYYMNFQKHIAKDHVNEHYPSIIKKYMDRVNKYENCNIMQNEA